MTSLLAARVQLTPRPPRRRPAVLEVAMLGHCPGRSRPERLLALAQALEEMRAAGFGPAVERLQAGAGTLFHLPIPLRSSAEFHDIFPEAGTAASGYVSVLAGNRAWLARSVDDFFANGGHKLWLVVIPEDAGQDGFFPAEQTVLHDTSTLRGLATVLVIPSVGVVALPDLERLQIPPRLPDIPATRLDSPDPQFLPCSTEIPAPRPPYASELGGMPDPLPLNRVLRGILSWLNRHRPDIQYLLTLPLTYHRQRQTPAVSEEALALIRQIRGTHQGHTLRHVQFLFPYLRGPGLPLCSSVGAIAGQQSAVSQQSGPWRSVAARRLITGALPFPPQSVAQTIGLRDDPGIGILVHRSGRVSLDDERLVVPALPPEDYRHHTDPSRFDGFRSAEVMRFMGHLRRQLQALGEELIFNLDYRDPRPKLVLERFFRALQQQGALRGALPEQGFHIHQINRQEGAAIFEIMVAPAFPVDRIRLTFTNRHGQWQEASGHG